MQAVYFLFCQGVDLQLLLDGVGHALAPPSTSSGDNLLVKYLLVSFLHFKNHKNTTAAVIRSLLDKGYLEISDIRYSTTVLARAYKPCVSILEFLKNEYGELSVEKIVGHLISTMEDTQVLNQLLALISEKNILSKKVVES